jgi:beta-N-acetylhexosaminidase
MKAIDQDMDTCMARILASQIDLALICHQGPDIEKAVIALTRQLASDPEAQEAGRVCLERMYGYKEKYLGWKKPDQW